MAATQPFLSGAISKTVNLPSSATVEDIADAYMMAWRKGLEGSRNLSRWLEVRPARQRDQGGNRKRSRDSSS